MMEKARWKKLGCFLLALALLGGGLTVSAAEGGEGSGLYVKKIDSLPEDFILGMDVSSLLSLEKSGVTYRDADGREADLFALLADAGINTIRVRVWNDPWDSAGHGYGGGNCDAAAAA